MTAATLDQPVTLAIDEVAPVRHRAGVALLVASCLPAAVGRILVLGGLLVAFVIGASWEGTRDVLCGSWAWLPPAAIALAAAAVALHRAPLGRALGTALLVGAALAVVVVLDVLLIHPWIQLWQPGIELALDAEETRAALGPLGQPFTFVALGVGCLLLAHGLRRAGGLLEQPDAGPSEADLRVCTGTVLAGLVAAFALRLQLPVFLLIFKEIGVSLPPSAELVLALADICENYLLPGRCDAGTVLLAAALFVAPALAIWPRCRLVARGLHVALMGAAAVLALVSVELFRVVSLKL